MHAAEPPPDAHPDAPGGGRGAVAGPAHAVAVDRALGEASAGGRLGDPRAVRALLAVGVVAVSFAAVLIRVADAPAVALAFWRSLGGAVVLAPVAVASRRGPDRGRPRRGTRAAPIAPADRVAMTAAGVCLAVHFALFIGAFAHTSVASAVVFVATSPIFVGLGSWVLLHQPPTRRTWAGIAVAAAGTGVVALADAGSGATGSDPLLGDLMALGGAVAVSGYLLIGQRMRTRLPVSVYGTWVYGVSAVVLLAVALTTGSPLVGFDAATWWAIVGLLVGPQLLGHTIFNQVLGQVPATTVAVVVLSEPVAAGLLALLLLGEVPSPLLAVGGPLILAGVHLAATGRRRRAG